MASDAGGSDFPPTLYPNDITMSVEGTPLGPKGSTVSFPQPQPHQEGSTAGANTLPFPVAQVADDRLPLSFVDSTGSSRHLHVSQASSRPEAPPDSYDDSAPTIDRDSISHTSRQYASIAAHDTPKAMGATREFRKGESVRVQGKSILTTMGRAIYSSDDWVDDDLAGELGYNESSLNRWLRNKDLVAHFDFKTIVEEKGTKPKKDKGAGKRWLDIPEKPKLESELYDGFVELISKVMKVILNHGSERRVFDTHNKQLLHFEEHHTSPDIVVRGTGSSFEMPSTGKPVGYSNIVTFFEIKLDSEMTREENLEQLVVYARQIFIHQPNRMFVRGLLISQKRVQLFHFDHGGIQRTPFYDIHKQPAAFLSMLLALTTPANDRSYVGLDDSLRWVLNSQGMKKLGTLRMFVKNGVRYLELVGTVPVSHHRHIRGSGTICWRAHDPKAKVYTEYLVKDSWSSEGRTPEWELLARANGKGIRGVAVMAWHEGCIAEVSTFRCSDTVDFFFNRIFSRIVMETYGLEIQNFKSLIQLLRALRDALAAHGNLYGAGILHRDISNHTILLGREGAAVGDQGILIDLSVAFDYHGGGNSAINKEPILTSRFFQSCAILDFLTELDEDDSQELAPAHDYLDDLESFFFVLCFLLFGFKPNGEPREPKDKARNVIREWDSEEADHALARKNMLLSSSRRHRDLAAAIVGRSWGEPSRSLFEEYLDWVIRIQAEKARLRREKYPEFLRKREELIKEEQEALTAVASGAPTSPQGKAKEPVYLKSIYASLYSDAQKHYDQLLEIFKRAIMRVETSPAAGEAAPKVSIPNADPTLGADANQKCVQSKNGPINSFQTYDSAKRRRISSITQRGEGFKVPEVPPAKASRHDEDGNGAAWMMRGSGSSSDLDNPFL